LGESSNTIHTGWTFLINPFVAFSFLPTISAESTKEQDNDYDRAEQAIFHVIEQVESKLQKAVEEEVHSIYDKAERHHQRTQVTDQVSKAVSKGSDKIKEVVREHGKVKARGMPFLPVDQQEVKHDDHKILHAIEAAETAVLHAVQEEVNSLFHAMAHEEDHPLQTSSAKTKEVVQKGLEKTKEQVDVGHKERRRWMHEMDSNEIDLYLKATNSLFGMGF
jgi:hypothetical protein